jgi:hypothetical protein
MTAVGLFALFTVEVSPAHAQVDRLSNGKLIYLPLLGCLGICVWRLARGSGQVTVMRVGLVTLVGSYAMHVLGPDVLREVGWGPNSWAYQVKVGLKEGTEFAGWLLVVVALWRAGAARPRRSAGRFPYPRRLARQRISGMPGRTARDDGEAGRMGCGQTDQP